MNSVVFIFNSSSKTVWYWLVTLSLYIYSSSSGLCCRGTERFILAQEQAACINTNNTLSVQSCKHSKALGQITFSLDNLHEKSKVLSSWLVEVRDYVLVLSAVNLISSLIKVYAHPVAVLRLTFTKNCWLRKPQNIWHSWICVYYSRSMRMKKTYFCIIWFLTDR
jgi:hypothetical protein